jgi:curli biogenesis system outer membrane secretion channel CsgG
MKALLSVLALIGSFSALASGPNDAGKVRVSVSRFKDKSASAASYGANCHGYAIWADRLGDAFSDVLVEKLEASGKVDVLERETIHDINGDEVHLANSSDDHSIVRGKFLKAKITFVGAVDGFEYCEDASGVGVNVGQLFGFGDVTPRMRNSSASLSIIIRAIDTTTGRVLATARSKQKQSRKSLGISGQIDSVDFDGADFRQSPLGESIQAAIADATSQILGKLRI